MRNYVTFHEKVGNFLKHYKFRRCGKLHFLLISRLQFLVYRRRHSVHFLERLNEACGGIVTKFFVDSLYGHIAIVVLVGKTAASLADAVFVEHRLEVLSIHVIDNP